MPAPQCSSRGGRQTGYLAPTVDHTAAAWIPRLDPVDSELRQVRGTSLGPVAGAYERFRPLHPEEAVPWLVGHAPADVLPLVTGLVCEPPPASDNTRVTHSRRVVRVAALSSERSGSPYELWRNGRRCSASPGRFAARNAGTGGDLPYVTECFRAARRL